MYDGILGFVMALAIILFTTKIVGLFTRRIGLPQVLGYILAGLIIGPAVFGLFGFSLIGFEGSGIHSLIIIDTFITTVGEQKTVLDIFSKIGVILIMFSAGLETNLRHLKETGLTATVIAFSGVAVPLLLGFGVSVPFMATGVLNAPSYSFDSIIKCVYVGVILTATSVAITVSVLKELKVINSKIATTVVSAAIIDDVIGMVILSITTALAGGNETSLSGFDWFRAQWWGILILIVVFFGVAVVLGILFHKLFSWLDEKYPRAERISLFGLVICFAFAFLAEKIFGIADITGAYVAGIMLSTVHRSANWTERNVDANTFMIFGPVFFASIGMNMSFSNISGWFVLFSVCAVLAGLVGKILGCGAVTMLRRGTLREAGIAGFGMMARGEVALIITNKGIEMGLISTDFMIMTVLLILVSSVLTPIMLKVLFKNYKPYSEVQGELLISQRPVKNDDGSL